MKRRLLEFVSFLMVLGTLEVPARAQSPGRPVVEPPLEMEQPAPKSSTKPAPSGTPAKPAPAPLPKEAATLPLETPEEPASGAAPFALQGNEDSGSPFDEPGTLVMPLQEEPALETQGASKPQGAVTSTAKQPNLRSVDPRDSAVQKVQNPARGTAASERNPLSPAKEAPGAVPVSVVTTGSSGDSSILPADRLTTGPNQVNMAVEVRAPEVSNLFVQNVFGIRVKNTGAGDAAGVSVRYPLPDNVEFVDAEPTPARNDGRVYYWQLNNMPGGSERTIKVKVKPTAKGSYDHAVTVSVLSGGRARTMVRQPELKLEARSDKTKVLKGTPVIYDITLTNTGDHPAKDVEIQAKLTPGLNHPKGTELALKLKPEMGIASIEPGQSVPLKLEVDTTGMGLQTVDLSATSPDIPAPVSTRSEIEVVAPDLKVVVDGPSERYPDNMANYKLTVTNAGSAPAKSVLVAAQVPTAGRPESVTPKGKWVPEARTYVWSIPELAPGSSEVFNLQVRMGPIGLFTLRTGAKAQGVQPVNRTLNTDIKGLSKLAMTVNEPRGSLDEGEESTYEIRVRNEGSKEAERVQIRGVVSDNLQVLSVVDSNSKAGSQQAPDPQTALFQQIDRLPQGSEVTLSFRVRAIKSGNGTCTVTAVHDDIAVPISQSMLTRVLPGNGPVSR